MSTSPQDVGTASVCKRDGVGYENVPMTRGLWDAAMRLQALAANEGLDASIRFYKKPPKEASDERPTESGRVCAGGRPLRDVP